MTELRCQTWSSVVEGGAVGRSPWVDVATHALAGNADVELARESEFNVPVPFVPASREEMRYG